MRLRSGLWDEQWSSWWTGGLSWSKRNVPVTNLPHIRQKIIVQNDFIALRIQSSKHRNKWTKANSPTHLFLHQLSQWAHHPSVHQCQHVVRIIFPRNWFPLFVTQGVPCTNLVNEQHSVLWSFDYSLLLNHGMHWQTPLPNGSISPIVFETDDFVSGSRVRQTRYLRR